MSNRLNFLVFLLGLRLLVLGYTIGDIMQLLLNTLLALQGDFVHNFIPFLLLIGSLVPFSLQAESHEYEVSKVEHKNLVANLYLPKTEKKLPVVIAFGGSEGGLDTGNANGEMIAPHGVAVLGLGIL